MSAIPIACYGNNPSFAEAVRAELLPEYDVVHIVLTVDEALTELPKVVAGNLSIVPKSGLGSNVSRIESSRIVPKIVFFGAAVPEHEVEVVTTAVTAVDGTVKTLQIRPQDIVAAGFPPGPNAEIVAKVLKLKLKEISV